MGLIKPRQDFFIKAFEIEKGPHYIEQREFFNRPTQKWDIYPSYTMLYCFDNDPRCLVPRYAGVYVISYRGRNYGTNIAWKRQNNGGSASSDTT